MRLRDALQAVQPLCSYEWSKLPGEVTSMRFLSLMFLIVLCACVTPQERAEEMANYINANYGPVCEKLGYAQGSDEHRNCMVSMYNADEIRTGLTWGRPWGRRW